MQPLRYARMCDNDPMLKQKPSTRRMRDGRKIGDRRKLHSFLNEWKFVNVPSIPIFLGYTPSLLVY